MSGRSRRQAEPPESAEPAGPAEPEEALAGVVSRLRGELDGLRRAMRNRAVIEQAKGVLVERHGIDPDAAFDRLVTLSQRSNVKLAEVAAAVIGARAPEPGGPGDRAPADAPLAARHHLLAARIEDATGPDQVAATLAEAGPAGRGGTAAGPDAVLIVLARPDGTVHPVGRHGAGPELERAARAALEGRAPAVLPDGAGTVLGVPLLTGDRTLGAFALGWSGPVELAAEDRRYLAALAGPVARRLAALLPAGASAPDDPVSRTVDALPTPAALLAPVRDDRRRIVDFRCEHGNAAAVASVAALIGPAPRAGHRTLLSVLPETGSRLLLAPFARAFTDGTPCHLTEVPVDPPATEGRTPAARPVLARLDAERLGDVLLVGWQPGTDADLLHDQLLRAERIGRIGSFWWHRDTGGARWSPELYRLLGRDTAGPPLPLPDLAGEAHPEDRAAVTRAVRDALAEGTPFTVEHRVADAPGRRLRISGEPEFDDDGRVVAVRGTVQDVTTERATESALRRTREALAAQRQRSETEAQAARALQRALLPTDPERTGTAGLAVAGAYRSAGQDGPDGRVAGDWYDVFAAPDGATMLVVGDVAGTGLAATVAAARLRNAVRAYGALGMAPGDLLGALNRMAAGSTDSLATLVVARFTPSDRTLWWAAAGQAAPVHYTAGGTGSVLSGPLGLPVGAAPDIGYEQARVDLAVGERLLLYTDGLVARRNGSLFAGLDVLLRAGRRADRADLDDVDGLVARVTERIGTPPDDDLCVIVARATR